MQAQDEIMTSRELAEMLKVHKNAPYEWRCDRRADQPPHFKVGSLIRYERSAVLRWIAERNVVSAAA